MNETSEKYMKQNISLASQGGTLSSKDKACLKEEIEKNIRQATKMRQIGKAIRSEISNRLKEIGVKPSAASKRINWKTFKKQHLNKFGKDLINIKRFDKIWSQHIALNHWITNKERCPFFTEWVTGLLYMQYYAMLYPNDPLDKNAQADIQHLMYLRAVDGIVSEDRKFMKRAWEDLYEPLGKKYLSIEALSEVMK